MDIDTNSNHGQAMDGDFHGTDDNCDSGSQNGSSKPNVIDGMDLDLVQDENPLFVPPDQDSPSHILKALNDHCLYLVFKRLHFLDLLNVVKVCIRFENQAKKAFASKYKKLELDIRQCDRNTMESILSIFGSSIRSLCIYSNQDAADGDLFRAIIKNCSAELKKLLLLNFNIQMDTPNFRLPFPKLEELELRGCVGNMNLAHLIDVCPDVKRILVMQCNLQGLNEVINRRFQKLEELRIFKCDFDMDTDAFEHFIVSNPALIKLTIFQSKIRTSNVFRLISQSMLKLQGLHLNLLIDDFQHFQRDVGYIGQLHSLKSLALNFNSLEVTPLMNALATNNVPIEKLSIFRGFIDAIAIKCISQLKWITSLELLYIDGFNEAHLINLARNLTNLQTVALLGVKNVDGNGVLTIEGLMQMIHYAKQLNCLRL